MCNYMYIVHRTCNDNETHRITLNEENCERNDKNRRIVQYCSCPMSHASYATLTFASSFANNIHIYQ